MAETKRCQYRTYGNICNSRRYSFPDGFQFYHGHGHPEPGSIPISNRVLDKLIGNRLQQVVLGTYIGTIVYSLFLLTSIRDSDTGIYVPSISTYLLITFSIIDIFFFIYFLHFITQSVKYAVIIRRIYKQTQQELKDHCTADIETEVENIPGGIPLAAPHSGILNGLNQTGLMRVLEKMNGRATLVYPPTTYVIRDMPVIFIHTSDTEIDDELAGSILENLFINEMQNIDTSYYYGFRQLTEVAIKALSPGINDPGTAVESLRSLTSLLAYRLKHHPPRLISDDNGNIRITRKEYSFEELFHLCLLPIWEYGKNDLFIQTEMLHLLQQLQFQQHHPAINRLIQKVQQQQVMSKNN